MVQKGDLLGCPHCGSQNCQIIEQIWKVDESYCEYATCLDCQKSYNRKVSWAELPPRLQERARKAFSS